MQDTILSLQKLNADDKQDPEPQASAASILACGHDSTISLTLCGPPKR